MILKIDTSVRVPKYQQIIDVCLKNIESGVLNVGDSMPSIAKISQVNKVAKETVVKAYKKLKLMGIIESTEKKGFFILTNNTRKKWRVLVLFNILSPSKEIIYKSIINTLNGNADVDLFFHNYNAEIFENIIKSKAAVYHYFIIMPCYNPSSNEILKILPPDKLFILDHPLKHHINGACSVHQDFKMDVYNALMSQRESVLKYNKLVVFFPEGKNLPKEIINGIRLFSSDNKMNLKVAESPCSKMLQPGTLFITTTDDLLIEVMELQQNTTFKLGKDIGIISYNENPLKKILGGGITTISSDFAKMGSTVSELLLKKESPYIHNPFNLIKRKSL